MPLSPVRRRSRTRHASLSTGQSVYDWLVLILVALGTLAGGMAVRRGALVVHRAPDGFDLSGHGSVRPALWGSSATA
jgi:hypothetical protein